MITKAEIEAVDGTQFPALSFQKNVRFWAGRSRLTRMLLSWHWIRSILLKFAASSEALPQRSRRGCIKSA